MTDFWYKHRITVLYIIAFLDIALIALNIISRVLPDTPPNSYYLHIEWSFLTSTQFQDDILAALISFLSSELIAIIVLLTLKHTELIFEFATVWIGILKIVLCIVLSPIFLFTFWLPDLIKYIHSERKKEGI